LVSPVRRNPFAGLTKALILARGPRGSGRS
jgi:hypothetical protein